MAFTSIFSPNLIAVSSSPASKTVFPFNSSSLSFIFPLHTCKKREFSLPSVASIPYQPINVDYLEEEFSGHGVTFERLEDICVAKMRVDNGSMAALMLPSGLITSYKAKMWHGGTQELLQTTVLEGEDGNAVIQGGVSLAFNFESDGERTWSPSTWSLHNIRGSSHDSIQVELISTDAMDKVDLRCIISLHEDALRSELKVTNAKSSPIHLTGSIITHMTVSTPEATFAHGLGGSDFICKPMFLSNFSIVPPDPGQEFGFAFRKLWGNRGPNGFFPGWGDQDKVDKATTRQESSEEETEGEEDDNYKNLTEEMSRIYTSAPRDFTIMDRGRRNSVVVGRNGFDELYMFSPGSSYESYGKYSYVCVGQSAMLKPIILSPGEVWAGEQLLHNPNL